MIHGSISLATATEHHGWIRLEEFFIDQYLRRLNNHNYNHNHNYNDNKTTLLHPSRTPFRLEFSQLRQARHRHHRQRCPMAQLMVRPFPMATEESAEVVEVESVREEAHLQGVMMFVFNANG